MTETSSRWWHWRSRRRGVGSPSPEGAATTDLACTHLDTLSDARPSSPGCEDCLAAGERSWVHLRMCRECGHVGCCNNSPGLHASSHFQETGHPIIQSYEPGQDWLWCYVDKTYLEPVEPGPSPSHP